MSVQAPNFTTPPSDKETPSQERGLFHHEAKKHECHHCKSHSKAACSERLLIYFIRRQNVWRYERLLSYHSRPSNRHLIATIGQVLNAMMWGFGATLGADAANAAVGDVKEVCVPNWEVAERRC